MIPTPEQARQLVERFGGIKPAAREIGFHPTTVKNWLDPEWRERKYAYAREYNRGWYARLSPYKVAERELRQRRIKALQRRVTREQRRQTDGSLSA